MHLANKAWINSLTPLRFLFSEFKSRTCLVLYLQSLKAVRIGGPIVFSPWGRSCKLYFTIGFFDTIAGELHFVVPLPEYPTH